MDNLLHVHIDEATKTFHRHDCEFAGKQKPWHIAANQRLAEISGSMPCEHCIPGGDLFFALIDFLSEIRVFAESESVTKSELWAGGRLYEAFCRLRTVYQARKRKPMQILWWSSFRKHYSNEKVTDQEFRKNRWQFVMAVAMWAKEELRVLLSGHGGEPFPNTGVDSPPESIAKSPSRLLQGTDTAKKKTPPLPDTPDVRDLCHLLSKNRGKGKSLAQIAREFTDEERGNDQKAQSLLRQARRFRHLWSGQQR